MLHYFITFLVLCAGMKIGTHLSALQLRKAHTKAMFNKDFGLEKQEWKKQHKITK